MHAYVYWARSDTDPNTIALLRQGLPIVPFQERTLINGYLLKSGYYELDKASIHLPGMLETLESADSTEGPQGPPRAP